MPRTSAIAYNIIEANSQEDPVYIVYSYLGSSFYVTLLLEDGSEFSTEEYDFGSDLSEYQYCTTIRGSADVEDGSIIIYDSANSLIGVLCPNGDSYSLDASEYSGEPVAISMPTYDVDYDKIHFFHREELVSVGGNNYEYMVRNMSVNSDLTGISVEDSENFAYATNDPGDLNFVTSFSTSTYYGCVFEVPDEYTRKTIVYCQKSTNSISYDSGGADISINSQFYHEIIGGSIGLSTDDNYVAFNLTDVMLEDDIGTWSDEEFDLLYDNKFSMKSLSVKGASALVTFGDQDDFLYKMQRASLLATGPEFTKTITLSEETNEIGFSIIGVAEI